MEYTYFKAVKAIPELNIKVKDIFYTKDDGRIASVDGDKLLPEYIDVKSQYFKLITIDRDFLVTDIIQYKYYKSSYSRQFEKYSGTVTNVYPYGLRVKRQGTGSNPKYDDIKFTDVIKKEDVYWFISSSGKIQYVIKGVNPEADTFRDRVGNMFTCKSAAYHALQKLLTDTK